MPVTIKRAKSVLQTAQRKLLMYAGMTDYARWSREKNLNPNWQDRARAAWSLRRDETWIADLGCGRQDLRKLVPPHGVYLPMDIVARTPDTLVCDINAKLLPHEYLDLCELCFVLGVLEYVYDPGWLLERLAIHCRAIILSYCTTELVVDGRISRGWVNSFDMSALVSLLERASFKVAKVRHLPEQVLLRAENTGSSAGGVDDGEMGRRASSGRLALLRSDR